ncbi:MAG: 4a-hydroxytetrahydrobiopterin dehydratase [Solirubrobacterales bacterium]
MELLSEEEIQAGLAGVPAWSRDGAAISRTFDCGDFKGAVALLNAVTELAETLNHHPDVAIAWKDLTLTLSTHSLGGLTAGDFELARRIDALA